MPRVTQFSEHARALSQKRRDAAETFAGSCRICWASLRWGGRSSNCDSRPNPPESAWSENGVDVAECYLSANVGEDLRPLASIASGGELSRVMLAIRTLAAADAPGKTLIFDEIDAGIGGRVADVVGKRLSRIGAVIPGAVHHAPAADCRRRPRTFSDFQDRWRTDAPRRAWCS